MIRPTIHELREIQLPRCHVCGPRCHAEAQLRRVRVPSKEGPRA